MKLLLRILFFLTLLLSTGVNAQTYTISPENIDANGLDYAKVIGQDEEGIYLLMSNLSLDSFRDRFGLRTRKYELSYFDFNLKLKWKRELSAQPSSGNIESISYFNGQVVMITGDRDKSTGDILLFTDVINAKGEFTVTQKKIYQSTLLKGADPKKARVVLSPDKTKLGIAVESPYNEGIQIHFCSISENFTPSKQMNAVIPYSNKDAELSDFAMSNNEDLLFLCYRKQESEEKEKRKLRNFSLQYLASGSNSFKEFVFNSLAQMMTEAALVIDRINNKAIVTGFFADKTSYAGASLLYGTLDLKNPSELKIAIGKLTNDAQTKLIGQRNTGAGVSLYAYPIQRVIPRSDGGALVIAEAAYLSEYSFYDYFTQTFNRRIEFHFDNILALSVNKDGSIHWSQLIQKEQTSMDDEGLYSSFNTVLTPEELSVIFNNDIGRNNEIVGHQINAQGKLTVKRYSRPGDSISILPRGGKQVDETTFIVPAVTKKRLFLMKVEIE